MARRSEHDVFVLGEESLAGEIVPREAAAAAAGEDPELDGASAAGRVPHRDLTGPARAPRRLAVLGLGAAAAATLGVLELSSGSPARGPEASPRSIPAAQPAPSAVRSAAPLASPPRHRRPSPGHDRATRRVPEEGGESKREPTPNLAPRSSPPPPPPPAAVVDPAPAPSEPSPAPAGGGSSGRENFGFER